MRTIQNCLVVFAAVLFSFNLTAQSNSCSGFRTQTQGGWGSNPNGNNPGAYLHANFSNAFPSGLQIGCLNKLRLTNANAVTKFLPSGGTSSALPSGTLVNPNKSYKNVLAGQLVAATLSVGFDNYDASFGANPMPIQNLVINYGPFQGWTIAMLLAEANNYIGGCGSNYPASTLNAALTAFNESYVDGIASGNFLSCPTIVFDPLIVSSDVVNNVCFGGNSGTASVSVSSGEAPFTYNWSNGAQTAEITDLEAGSYTVTVSDSIGQSAVLTMTVSQPAMMVPLVQSGAGNCFSNYLASVSASVASGGVAPYTYAWSNGEIENSFITDSSGSFQVTITDANGCTAEDSISAVVYNPMEADYSTNFSNGSGSALVEVFGGESPYSFQWSNGSTADNISGVAMGTYFVTVTDQQGCEIFFSVFVGPSNNKWEGSQTNFSFCPNPVKLNGDLTINYASELNNGTYEIIDYTGRLVVGQKKLIQGRNQINTSELNNSGIYFIVFKENGLIVSQERILVIE